jgi:hypothetical protein
MRRPGRFAVDDLDDVAFAGSDFRSCFGGTPNRLTARALLRRKASARKDALRM